MLSGAMRLFPATALVLVSLLLPATAGPAPATDARTDVGSEIVTTRHAITVKGAPLAYTARAGLIPLIDEATGEVHAKIFFVSYTVEQSRGNAVRPLTFYTEGGPGGPATLDALGPRSLKGVKVQVQLPPPPYEMVDNQKTWLTFTDLVLIDPVGAGYSGATKPGYAAQYYNREGDAESIAQFIKLYLQRYERVAPQPIFVAGVSYGATRSALIADIANRSGIPLRGLMLVSSCLAKQPYQVVRRPRRGEMPWHPSDLTYIQLLPTFTATAFFHKKLAPGLQRNFDETLGHAESWATRDYPKVLAQADGSNRKLLRAAAAEMGRLTGLSPEVILKYKFRIPPSDFLEELLGAQETPLGVDDSRRTKADEATGGVDGNWYAVLSSLYLDRELRFKSRVPYASLLAPAPSNIFFNGWNCQAREDNSTCLATAQTWLRLQRAMRGNPSLRVMITNGYYDTGCPYFGTKMAVSQLAPDLKARVSVTDFQAGHSLPPDLGAAVAGFIRRTTATSAGLPETGR